MSTTQTLVLYDPDCRTTDTSSYGLGAVLTQLQPDATEQPCSHICLSALTPTEQRYAQIEKEALALTWAYEQF